MRVFVLGPEALHGIRPLLRTVYKTSVCSMGLPKLIDIGFPLYVDSCKSVRYTCVNLSA